MALAAILGGGYQTETVNVLNRLGSTSIPAASAVRLDATIRRLKTAGILQLMDCFYRYAADNATLAKLNLAQNAYNCTAVNSPTFTAFRGFAGDGASSYLDTNFNPTTAPNPRYVQNRAFVMIYSGTNVTNGNYWDIGQNDVGDSSGLNARSSTGPDLRVRPGPNGSGSAVNFTANGTSLGLFAQSRLTSSGGTAFQNGNALGTHAVASIAPLNANFLVCAEVPSSSLYSARQIRFAAIGSGLTNAQVAELYRIIVADLGPIGAL